MKKIMAGFSALTLAGMMAMTAFAETGDTTVQPDDKGEPTPATAGMDVSYEVAPTFTVVIPAAVTLDPVQSVEKTITAADVKIESKQKIVVTLDEAENINGKETDGTTELTATTADKDAAKYTITAGGKALAVGGTAAEFTTSTEEQTATLTFSAPTGVNYAGKYSEKLTFGIKLEETV